MDSRLSRRSSSDARVDRQRHAARRESERRAWATVNKVHNGGEMPGGEMPGGEMPGRRRAAKCARDLIPARRMASVAHRLDLLPDLRSFALAVQDAQPGGNLLQPRQRFILQTRRLGVFLNGV